MCVHASSSTDEQVSKAFPNALFVRKVAEREIFLGIRQGECQLAVATASAWSYYWEHHLDANGDCDLEWIRRTFRHYPAGAATYSDSGSLSHH